MRNEPITNMADVLDSRDIIERIETLSSQTAPCPGCAEAGALETRDHCATCGGEGEIPDLDEDEAEELASLRTLAEQGKGYGDWAYGETLIRYSYFETYAEEFAEDIGDMSSKAAQAWPFRHIDWEAAADELKQDYTSLDFDGVEYWMRS